MMGTLPRSFYSRDPVIVARDLLGMRLVRRTREGVTSGWIVEVEAYLAQQDSACHASRGATRGNRAMFGLPGRAYVYPIHSRHCFNVVTQAPGIPSAVLIRALEPLDGLPLMERRRRRQKPLELARGPARLCEALAIDRRLDRWDLTRGCRLWIEANATDPASGYRIGQSPRIGVTSAHDLPLRFFLKDNPFVSGGRWPRKASTDGEAGTATGQEQRLCMHSLP